MYTCIYAYVIEGQVPLSGHVFCSVLCVCGCIYVQIICKYKHTSICIRTYIYAYI